jgi:peptidoglycan/LPS O-acetylase OafA/YrhL
MAVANDRLFALDVARGLAAIFVVVYHWRLFFYVTEYGIAPENYPLHAFLAPIQKNGWLGADFFFVLSGAIFFTKYSDAIAKRGLTARQFFILRFSRLAPLHYATLILTGVLQAFLFLQLGRFVLFREHLDQSHFLANLLFIQNWGFLSFLSDSSFNIPAWSISIEALLYILFFLLFRFLPANLFCFLTIAAAGFWLIHSDVNAPLGRGLWCFFAGGSVAWFYTRPVQIGRYKPELYGAALLLLFLIVFKSQPGAEGAPAPTGLRMETASYFLYTGFFACFVGCLAFSEGVLRRVARPLSFLGDISYSSYLLHYPLQLAFIFVVVLLNGAFEPALFRSPWMMLLFFAILIAASLLSFRYFEAPLRTALRLAYLNEKKAVPEPAVSELTTTAEIDVKRPSSSRAV